MARATLILCGALIVATIPATAHALPKKDAPCMLIKIVRHRGKLRTVGPTSAETTTSVNRARMCLAVPPGGECGRLNLEVVVADGDKAPPPHAVAFAVTVAFATANKE